MKLLAARLALVLTAWLAAVASAQAQATPDVSFAGKRINLFIGFSATGFGYDTYGRVLARYLTKHLPGNPTVVPQNKPGAGSLTLMNYIANVAPRDGTEIGLVGRGAAMEPLLGGDASAAKFDATKLAWIGSMNNEVAGFFLASTAPAKDLKEILAGKPVQVGSTGSGGDPYIFATAVNAVLKSNLKVIAGYPGMNEIVLAINRGELDGVLGYSWGVARLGIRDELKEGKVKLVMQLALKKHAELKDVPLVTELVPEGEGKKVLELIFARQSMGRPLVAPPGVDPRTVAALRKAFSDTMHDREFLAEAEKIGLEINFVSGDEVEALVKSLYALPDSVVKQAQRIIASK
jgi:tripartite-type tricarboxylate transporter receptor subunit TctC